MTTKKNAKRISALIEKNQEKADAEEVILQSYGGGFLEYRDSYRFFVRMFVGTCYLVVLLIFISFGVYLAKEPSQVYVTTYSGELYQPEVCSQRETCGLKDEK